jgi:cobalt-zinc-cadmium efflux system outer membrane protein
MKFVTRWSLACACAASLMVSSASAVGENEREVPLEELLAFAEGHAPAVQLAKRRRAYGPAAKAGADPLFRQNPTLGFAMGPRRVGSLGTALDVQVSLAQPVEISGARGLRRDAATRLGERLDKEASAASWEVRRLVTLAFASGVLGRQRVDVATRVARFAEEMLAATRRQLEAGEGNAIDALVAEATLAQARQAVLAAEQELRSSLIELCLLTGWPLETPPLVPAQLEPVTAPPPLAAVLRKAAQGHPELLARRAETAEAHVNVELADREAWPSPVLGVQLTREGGVAGPNSDVLLGTLQVPLPFWELNQGARAERRVDEDLARAEEQVSRNALSGRIARAHSELSAASARVALLTSGASASLEQSLSLIQRGFEAGELPLTRVADARDRLLEVQLSALDAYAEYYRALGELESALGAPLDAVRAPEGSR